MSSNELLQYASGNAPVARMDRAVAQRAKEYYDEVRLRSFRADGAMALAGHIMEGITALDARRQALAKDDPMMNGILGQIEAVAITQARTIQENLYNPWNL